MKLIHVRSRYPKTTTPSRLTWSRFWLLPLRSPLLRQSLIWFLLSTGTKMFQFPAFASSSLLYSRWDRFLRNGVPPFGLPRINACLITPRGLSWPTPSFFACMSLGILSAPSCSLIRLLLRSTQTSSTSVSFWFFLRKSILLTSSAASHFSQCLPRSSNTSLLKSKTYFVACSVFVNSLKL